MGGIHTMDSSKLVSVVIPAYNADKYIDKAIRSVALQTHENIELIVVEDGSTDKTLKKLYKMIGEIDMLIEHETNEGVAKALNDGMKEAAGNYIAILAADDEWLSSSKLKNQVYAMEQNNADMSYYTEFYRGPDIFEKKRIIPPCPPKITLLSLVYNNPINGSSVMFKSDWCKKAGLFDEVVGQIDQDGDLYMRYCMLGANILGVVGSPILYRSHDGQLSSDRRRMDWGSELTRMRILKLIKNKGKLDDYIKETPIIPFILDGIDKGIRNKPMCTRMLVEHIGSNEAVRKMDEFIERTGISKKLFAEDLMRIEKSDVFKDFKKKMVKKWQDA
jgi:glycosyltransferase involved in cell wall biosynthesis